LDDIAEKTVQRRAEAFPAGGLGEDPGPELPRRLVPDMLGVTTREVGDPVSLGILVKTSNCSFHGRPIQGSRST
jgi:hypothetical protein